MLSSLRLSSVLSLAVFTGILAYGQNPDRHTVVNCVKVKEGKNAEYTAYLRDVTKLYKSRVESGEVKRLYHCASRRTGGPFCPLRLSHRDRLHWIPPRNWRCRKARRRSQKSRHLDDRCGIHRQARLAR